MHALEHVALTSFNKDFLVLKSSLHNARIKHGIRVCFDGFIQDEFHLVLRLGCHADIEPQAETAQQGCDGIDGHGDSQQAQTCHAHTYELIFRR